jgi:hypothetical protein
MPLNIVILSSQSSNWSVLRRVPHGKELVRLCFQKKQCYHSRFFTSETEILLQAFPKRNENSTDKCDFITEITYLKSFCYSVGFNALNFYCRLHNSSKYYHSFWLFINRIHVF